MEGKHPHAPDNSVVERRLRPIYEWLDSGNNKKAYQECDKVLKKTPNLLCAKALKAVAFLRSGRESECINILEGLGNEKPTDEPTLQAMTICFRELDQLEKIHPLYEAALKLDPTNEELHTHLFISYVRIGDFKSQQQAAMSLYKLKPRVPYYCWAIMSIILQATRGPDSANMTKRNVLISLAERMITKLQSEGKLDAEQEIQLYILILQLQGKHEEILKVLETKLDEKHVHLNNLSNKLPHLKQLNRYEEINILCKKLLIDNPDKWDVWKEYVGSVFKLNETNGVEKKAEIVENHMEKNNDLDYLETPDNNAEKAHEFICHVIENGSVNEFQLRGPYLARFELAKKLNEANLDSKIVLGDVLDLFIEYFRKFGHKPCCVNDLRIYLLLLTAEKRLDLAAKLMQDVGISATSVPQSNNQMQRHIGAIQLSRLCGSHRDLSQDHLKALVTALSLHYQHGYQTYGSNLLPTDQGPSDPYVLIAVHILYDIAQAVKSSEPIILALVLIDNLLKNSPSSFQAKLLGVKLYNALGCPIGAQAMYYDLDIKHLQLDSLGYIHCAVLPTSGLFNLAEGQYENTYKFFSTNYKDSLDHLTFSYKYGSFLKLEEFMDFREKLNNSYQYALISVEKVLLSLLTCSSLDCVLNSGNAGLILKEINWEKLRFNQDYDVHQNWYPERLCSSQNENEMNLLSQQDTLHLKLRYKILCLLQISINTTKSLDGVRETMVENLLSCLEEYKSLYANVPNELLKPISHAQVTYPFPSRLHISLDLKCHQVIRSFFQMIKPISEEDESLTQTLLKENENFLENLVKTFEEIISTHENKSSDSFFYRKNAMEKTVYICETLCISTLIFAICLQITRPPQGKKSKKKQENKVREYLVASAGKIKSALLKFEELLEFWSPTNACDIEDRLAALNLTADSQANVISNLKNSHLLALKEMSVVMKSKCKLIDSVLG